MQYGLLCERGGLRETDAGYCGCQQRPVQIDVSQAQHFRGVGSFDEAIDLEMRGYVARCAEDEAEVYNARDRARQLKAKRPIGHMKNHARRHLACKKAQHVPTEDDKRLAGRGQPCLTESCTCCLAPALWRGLLVAEVLDSHECKIIRWWTFLCLARSSRTASRDQVADCDKDEGCPRPLLPR